MRYFFLERKSVTEEMKDWVKFNNGVVDDGTFPSGNPYNLPVIIGLFVNENDAVAFKLKFGL